MKEMFISYAAYNLWANGKLASLLLKLPEEQLDTEMGGSYGTIRATVYHLWDTEVMWYQRLLLAEQVKLPTEDFGGSFARGCELWLDQSKVWVDWVREATPVKLGHTIAYIHSRKSYKTAVLQLLQHVFNHATYHRGQLITLLRQAGVRKLPGLSYIEFTRQRKQS
ncbi:DinB family protein [Chitinophaga pendula]|uniref:DinB family protein n=1 Tax=Chitinophaga TaxID=79328 RepID=UPI000BAE6F6A|nr:MULTISPECIES: DinB family protein [Chitinophaga]ASZ14693.1 hypothetical protein CK934_28955 [Chitinophaga sp. MD30]UCJ07650.1 DinB family protein [Chitinophaga pendula]